MPSRPPTPEGSWLLAWGRRLLAEPALQSQDIDGPGRISGHRAVLEAKPALRAVFSHFYARCLELDRRLLAGSGPSIEIGAGTSFFRELAPGLVSTDVLFDPDLDLVTDALRLPFRNESLRAVHAINCFHHLPDPAQFFIELERTLVPGGGCVLIDPYYGPFARVFYRYLFAQETFDSRRDWTDTDAAGRAMSGANQALSYVVFVRDRARFQADHGHLEVVHHEVLSNYASYLLSGGLNFRSLLPPTWTRLYAAIDSGLRPLRSLLGLHHLLVLRKKAHGEPPDTADRR